MRIKRGKVTKRKHKKLLKSNKGYAGTNSRLIKDATEAYLHAGQYAYHGRKLRKRDNRALWIIRISEACKKEGISYSVFMNHLKNSQIDLNRKTLNDIIQNDPGTFKLIINSVR